MTSRLGRPRPRTLDYPFSHTFAQFDTAQRGLIGNVLHTCRAPR